MTTAAENEILTRVGPGTPMGNLMRNYWFPVARSDEATADGDPLRLMALGEKLIAFRDTQGRVGVMDQRCPHRCASLFFGRNEEGGIRCVYHGWKFDVDGNCVEMANVPPHQDFKHKVKAKAYPAQDRFGAIWIYMGDRDDVPAFPDFELNDVPDEDISVRLVQQEYNWLQGLENDLDTSHFGFLHLGGVDPEMIDPDDQMYHLAIDRAPQFHIEDTPMGLMYGAYRPADEANTHWRMAQYLTPFWVMPPAGNTDQLIVIKGYIPMDDEHTMTIMIARKQPGRPIGKLRNGEPIPGIGRGIFAMEYRDNTTDWFGRWRLENAPENDYLIDRDLQRDGGVYSGIVGIQVQDNAIAGTMGPITDRTFEQLATSDEMITRMRRKLLRLVQGYQKDHSMALPGVDNPSEYRGHRGGNFQAPNDVSFREAYETLIAKLTGEAPRWAAE